ncbi:MAG: 5'-nucleotidase C-terminal domain-containing protein [Humidesulfovibrio sp.]|uniref:bifunctional metallophosphatase/5'-nucleotidase n=1 Tax=Humidesulfovibrio sp. TaxID=2910988 RepID=UPI00273750E3|nr:5'-nucleotidase C-terminal domain-containing protein [Humidesulfovibrio sp.]MDP2847636.1 5'-nucleotidase C-terminal domain-containing protein [Humidesulfovibrio sp.]
MPHATKSRPAQRPGSGMAARLLPALALVMALALAACAAPRQPLSLTIAHMNDTHSALEPSDENLTVDADGQRQIVRAKLGGMARLKTALDEVRAGEKNVLTLHAGDAVQGTLYFNVFQGAPEFEFLNALGLDAMSLGNHEFDRGPAQLGRMLALARFPVLSANIDASEEPALAGSIRPYAILRFGAEPVGVIGSTTPSTPLMTKDVGRARFLDPAPAIRAAVAQLQAQGVNKIILLSHNGYDADQELAKTVAGLDVIVGGHTHTLLGDRARLASLGLKPAGPYPTVIQGPEGAAVLVVQAWKWGEVLGVLSMSFDAEGRITGHSAAPRLVAGDGFRMGGVALDPASADGKAVRAAVEASGIARVYPENPAMLAKLAPYAAKIAAFQNAPLGATAAKDMIRGTATDPGPLVADAYLAKMPGAQIAFVGAGGIRRDLLAGPLTQGQIMGVLPFGNTLVTLDLSGAQIKDALEDAVEFRLTTRPPENNDPNKIVVVHTAGLSYVIRPLQPKGKRIADLVLRPAAGTATPLDMTATYRLVTNSFLAGGGDGLTTLKNAVGNRVDTGYIEHDVFAEYLAALGAKGDISPPPARVVIEAPTGAGKLRSSLERAAERAELLSRAA